MLDEIVSKLSTKTKIVINRGKRNKKPNEVKPVENTIKKPQFSLKIIPAQGRLLLTEKLLEPIESFKFVPHQARISGEYFSRKNLQPWKL